MACNRKFKFNKTDKAEFAQKMKEIEKFCVENKITRSLNGDSYYFKLNNKSYRVSNHTLEASNKGAFNFMGTQTRNIYHEFNDFDFCITASKLRIIEIYTNLKNGIELDKRGNPKK